MVMNLFKIEKKRRSPVPPPPPDMLPAFGEPGEMDEGGVPLPPPEDLPTFPSPKKMKAPSLASLKKAAREEPIELDEFKSHIASQERHDIEHHTATKPLFLKIQDFKAVVDEINQARNNLGEAETALQNLDKVHGDQGKALKQWQSSMKDMHEKLIFIDEALFNGR